MNKELMRAEEEARQLRRLAVWSWYIKGARDMLLTLRNNALCDEPKPKGWVKEKEDKICNKAILDLILHSKTSIDRFLAHDYDEIRFADFERDKKGKLVKCRAYFAKSVTTAVEIKD